MLAKPWIDGDGEGIDYQPPDPDADKDYPEYVKNCIENTDPLTSEGPKMCRPKDCKNASQSSDEFRYCMFSIYASDTSLFDQYQDNDADLSGGGG